jgi:inosose dehydratase
VTVARPRLHLGTAPDSWGVWFADDPRQVGPQRFLDEARAAGYTRIELGPYGYLPTDPAILRGELERRGLTLTGGAIVAELGRGVDGFVEAIAAADEAAPLLSALDAGFLVLLPGGDRDDAGNRIHLGAEEWADICAGIDRLGGHVRDRWGLELVFHSHADSLVETEDEIVRVLEGTDPTAVGLCLDTGHVAYGGGDTVGLIGRFPERIRYVHLKQVDPLVLGRVRAERLRFDEAVARGVMVEPPHGEPGMPAVVEALAALDRDLVCIVEQDLFGCEPGRPFPIAKRTLDSFAGLGLDVGQVPAARG